MVVDGILSAKAAVKSGVPQGTVLGPILFLAYINDLAESVKSNVRLFPGDCLLYRPIRSLANQLCLQDDLNSLQDWAQKWCMNFNPSKCTVLHINRPRSKTYQHDYQLEGETLVTSTHIPYLTGHQLD